MSSDSSDETFTKRNIFEPQDFVKRPRVRTFDHSAESQIQDSWPLDDLYCDSIAYIDEDADDQMITLDDKHDVLAWACGIVSASPTARIMFNEAMEAGWSLALDDLCGMDYHLDVPEKHITLDNNGLIDRALGASEYFRNTVMIAFIRALRDVWQEKRHGAFETYNVEAALKLERIRAADLDVVSTLVAWELRAEGFGAVWRHLIGSDEGDIALRFAGYLERDPQALSSGKALSAAFTQWFIDERRVNTIDHQTLNAMDSAIAEYGPSAFGDEKLTPIRLEVLSCLPDKTAYLQGEGRDLLMDPQYAGLDDPINQAHFMQIGYDMCVTRVQDVPFRDASLAEKIFPGGQFTISNDLKN